MTRYHVSADGQARRCAAKSADSCRVIGLGLETPPHGEFETRDEANKFAEKHTANFFTPEEVAKRLQPGAIIKEFDSRDGERFHRYGSSSSVTMAKFTPKKAEVNIHVYDGENAKMDKLIGDTIDDLKTKGFTGNQVDFKITAKYNTGYIDAYDEDDETRPRSTGGKYGVSVGHSSIYANVRV